MFSNKKTHFSLFQDRCLVTPHVGCTLAVFDVGAYCASMGSNYNMRARPAEVLVDGDKVDLIRRADTLDSILLPYMSLGITRQPF